MRLDSLLWAFVIVGVSITGSYAFNIAGLDWLARAFSLPVWLPFFLPVLFCGGLHGCSGGLFYWLTAFMLGVLMWWCLIEGARYWRRGRHGT